MSSSTKDVVLAHLRKEKIKLWLPPYRNLPTAGAGDANVEALCRLAGSMQQSMPASSNNSIINARNNNSGDGHVGGGGTSATHHREYPSVEEICTVLKELQSHAIQKLKENNSINVKILASKQHFAPLLSTQKEDDATTASATNALFPSSWGDEVTIVSTSQKQKSDKALHLHVVNLSSSLTINQFSDDLCRVLDAKTVRVIWKGKNLGGEDGTLNKVMLGSSSSVQKKKCELLCLVTGVGYAPATQSTSMDAASAAATSQNNIRSESDIIASIRQAAHTIQLSNSSQRFEVTDQSGNLVPMLQCDTVAFMTALGLHRIGRSKMEKRDAFTAMMSDATTSATLNGGDDVTGRRDDIASALVFLLEADAEWNNSPALEGWQDKVDNYGLLQLDIAWCYLLLESLDGLTDAVRRLDIAERVLRKQVHSNFVTLAIAQADMDHPIPPMCAIFVRLFLLQGVANKMQNCNTTAAERLGWAQLLCTRLRSSAPPDSVEALCNAYFVDPSTAIAALRRSNGALDAAGNFITSDRDEEQQAAKKRRRQYRIGKCANGTDYLNLDLVPTLSGLLGFDCTAATAFDRGSEHGSFEDKQSTSTLIVVGLLRLSNNIIDQALELYNSIGADQVLRRVAHLDEASGRKKKQSKPKKPAEHEVQDVDVTMLVSMGVDESRARNALKATGNVESALLWLSKEDDGAGAVDDDKANENTKLIDGMPLAANGNLKSDDGSSSTRDHSGSDEGSDDTLVDDAFELLERELGNALGTDSKQLLEKEWLGVDMQDEWVMIQKYI